MKKQLLQCLLFALPVMAQGILPDNRLTPGAIASKDPSVVCRPGYSKTVRHTSGRLKHQIYVEYGLLGRHPGFSVDHRVPLELGGADVRANLWPESKATHPGDAEKNALENEIHDRVCREHTMTLAQGQAVFLGDWVKGYNTYVKRK